MFLAEYWAYVAFERSGTKVHTCTRSKYVGQIVGLFSKTLAKRNKNHKTLNETTQVIKTTADTMTTTTQATTSSTTSTDDNNIITDEFYMRQALKVAEAALKIGEVPVGCVLVLVHHESLPEPFASVIVSHGANQVNATRDATRHAEIVAIDRLLTGGASSDQLRLPPDIGTKSTPNTATTATTTSTDSVHTTILHPPEVRQARLEQWEDRWINVPEQPDHWKNSYGWKSTTNTAKNTTLASVDILQHCHLYVTCEPCIMCAAALATVGIGKVIFGCRNDRFGGCGSLLHLHQPEASSSEEEATTCNRSKGYEIVSGVLEQEAITLLRSFYDRENFHAPEDKRKRKDEI
jgi:tRNA(Arg) A34 adenosine deaminase TadA